MAKRNAAFIAVSLLLWGAFFSACSPRPAKVSLEEKSRSLHQKILTVDTHADTTSQLLEEGWNIGERHEPGLRSSGKIDLPRMAEGGLDAEFFAVFVGQGELTPEGYAKAQESAEKQLGAIHKMCQDYRDLVGLATRPEDAFRLEKEGKRAAFIGMENGYPVGEDLSLIQKYYERGVRYITLCHGGDNQICDSSTDRRDPEDRGLSEFGKKVVAECNRLGIMVDVSHSSDKSFYDVLAVTRAPVIASHSSVRSLCDHPRNLSDDMLRALKKNGGVVQVCFVSSFVKTAKPNPEREKALEELRKKYGSWGETRDEAAQEKMRQEYELVLEKYPTEKATLSDLCDHIDYVVKLIGINHVGIGSDFDGGGGVAGCDDVSEMPRITEELLRRGYTEEEIRKIWGGNLLRVFNQVIEVSKSLRH